MTHPSFGPVPPDKFAELVTAPYGKATAEIRKYDPLWGIPAGEKIQWRVDCERNYKTRGIAFVEASSEKEAAKKAENLCGGDVDWDYDDFDDFDILSIKPEPPK